MTTDSTGVAVCWASVVPYDVKISGSGVTTQLLEDVVPDGNERLVSNVFAGAGPAFIFDTLRALTTDDKIISVREAGVEKASIDDDGDIAGVKGTFSGAVAGTTGTFSGAVSGTTGTFSGAISGTTGTFSGAVSGTAGTFSSDVSMRRLLANQGTTLVDGDWGNKVGWGNTATHSVGGGSTDTQGSITITCSGSGITASPTIDLTFKDGAYAFAPYCLTIRQAGTDQPTIPFFAAALSTTQIRATFMGTPVAGQQYFFRWLVIGDKA